MKIIKELLTDQIKEAIAWGEKHPKEMDLNDNPYDLFDNYDEFKMWVLAQEAKRLETLTVDEQKFQLAANRSIQAKMNS